MTTWTTRHVLMPLLLLCVWSATASAADTPVDALQIMSYPNKPVRIVVAWPPQGGADYLARFLADQLRTSLRQRIIVENRAGAGGNVGAEHVARSPADGYTLLVSPGDTHVLNPILYGGQMSFQGIEDFEPVALIAYSDLALVTHPSINVPSVTELVALARARPGQLRFATPGPGTRGHLLTGLLEQRAEVNLDTVHYPGSAAAANAVTSGVNHALFGSYSSLAAHIKAKNLRLVATSGRRHAPHAALDVLAPFELELYYGLFVPKGTPRDIVERLNLHVSRAVDTPRARTRLAELGFYPEPGSADAFARTLAVDRVRWSRALASVKLAVPN